MTTTINYRLVYKNGQKDPLVNIMIKWLNRLGLKQARKFILEAVKAYWSLELSLEKQGKKEILSNEYIVVTEATQNINCLEKQMTQIKNILNLTEVSEELNQGIQRPLLREYSAQTGTESKVSQLEIRYQMAETNPDSFIIKYLKATREIEKYVLNPLESYWGAIAAKDLQILSDQELEQYGKYNLLQISRRIKALEIAIKQFQQKTDEPTYLSQENFLNLQSENFLNLKPENNDSSLNIKPNQPLVAKTQTSDNRVKSNNLPVNCFDDLL